MRGTRAEIGQAVVVDFSAVTFMDASGVAVLAGADKLAEAAGAAFRLRRPTRAIVRVLKITGLTRLIADEQA